MDISHEDRRSLIHDKYGGDTTADLREDITRLEKGEPLAYVIGWMPFLGQKIYLDSRPLIPRPETEWWTSLLITHLHERFGENPFTMLDMCAGSGAVGIAVLSALPRAKVFFAELEESHAATIKKNLEANGINASRADIRTSNVFDAFEGDMFDIVAANPPYIPSGRALPESVSSFEPSTALYSGKDGMDVIRAIAKDAGEHLNVGGELWMECDIDNVVEACDLIPKCQIHTDQYGRPRLLVGYY